MFLFHSNNDHTTTLHNASGKAKAFYKTKPLQSPLQRSSLKAKSYPITMTKGKQHDF